MHGIIYERADKRCDVTESVILSERYRGVTVPSCELKRKGFSGTKGFCSR